MKKVLPWLWITAGIVFLVAALTGSFSFVLKPTPISIAETQPKRYLVLGDSIGVGIGSAMKSVGVNVTVCAVSGQRHEKLPQQLATCAKGHYTHTIVSTGTNEASHRDSTVNASVILQWLSQYLATTTSVPIIVGPPCTYKWFDPYARDIDAYLSKLPVKTVSLRKFCANAADGVHHTPSQYLLMWKEIQSRL